MSKEQMIEEMARDIFEPQVAIDGIDIAFAAVHGADRNSDTHFMRIARHLYSKGYRKQSEGEWKKAPDGTHWCSECGHDATTHLMEQRYAELLAHSAERK